MSHAEAVAAAKDLLCFLRAVPMFGRLDLYSRMRDNEVYHPLNMKRDKVRDEAGRKKKKKHGKNKNHFYQITSFISFLDINFFLLLRKQ